VENLPPVPGAITFLDPKPLGMLPMRPHMHEEPVMRALPRRWSSGTMALSLLSAVLLGTLCASAEENDLALARALFEGYAKYLDSLPKGEVLAEVEDVHDVAGPADANPTEKQQITVRGHARFVYRGKLGSGDYLCEWKQDKRVVQGRKVQQLPEDYRVVYLEVGKRRYILEIDSLSHYEELRIWPRVGTPAGANPYFHLARYLPLSDEPGPPTGDWLLRTADKVATKVRQVPGKDGAAPLFEVSRRWDSPVRGGGTQTDQSTCLIDKARGCLVTRLVYRRRRHGSAKAVTTQLTDVTYKRHSPDLFLPQAIVQTEWDEETGKRRPIRKIRLTFNSIGKPVDDSVFTLDAMKIPDGTHVHDDSVRPHRGWTYGKPRKTESWVMKVPKDVKPVFEKKVSFDFAGTPFPDVVRFLRELTGVKFAVDAKVSKASPDLRVTLKLTDMPLKTALGWLMKVSKLDCTYHNGGIYISDVETIKGINAKKE